LNLIRVMPAKGQGLERFPSQADPEPLSDIQARISRAGKRHAEDCMERSVYLARLIGPVFIIVGLGVVINAEFYRAMAEQVLHNAGLIYASGVLTLLGGIAVVLAHNVWDGSWRVIVTALGWAGVFGGVFRILAPKEVEVIGTYAMAHTAYPVAGALFILLIGAVLSYFGYADIPPSSGTRARKRTRR
jgi:hypothetical protein